MPVTITIESSARQVAPGAQWPSTDATNTPPVEPTGDGETASVLQQLMSSRMASRRCAEDAQPSAPPFAPASFAFGQAHLIDEGNNLQTQTATPFDRPVPTPAAGMDKMDAMLTLQSHMDKVPDKLLTGDLDALSKDETLPADLREAYGYLRDHPDVADGLDKMTCGKDDNIIAKKDWQAAAESPDYVHASRELARAGVDNYIPSDASPDDGMPRRMTASDANRELYLYADSLPDKVDREALQKIVDGQCDKKCPAQLKAAAQYMLDNPAEFEKLAPGGKVGRGDLENNALANVNLQESELAAIRTVSSNRGAFLGKGPATRESLAALAANEGATQEVRQAAQKLLDDPLVFGLLDNAAKGHKCGKRYGPNDGKIGGGDLDALDRRLTATNLRPPAKPMAAASNAPRANETPAQAQARADMAAKATASMTNGWSDDPEIKIERPPKKSGFMNFLSKVVGVIGKVLDVAKTLVDSVAGLLPPPLGPALIAVGAGVATFNNFAVKTTSARLNGVSAKDAFKAASKAEAMDLAGSAMSVVPGGGIAKAGTAVGKVVVKEGAEVAVKEGVGATVKVGLKQGAADVASGEVLSVAMTEMSQRQGAQLAATDDVLDAALTEMTQARQLRAERQAVHEQAERQAAQEQAEAQAAQERTEAQAAQARTERQAARMRAGQK